MQQCVSSRIGRTGCGGERVMRGGGRRTRNGKVWVEGGRRGNGEGAKGKEEEWREVVERGTARADRKEEGRGRMNAEGGRVAERGGRKKGEQQGRRR